MYRVALTAGALAALTATVVVQRPELLNAPIFGPQQTAPPQDRSDAPVTAPRTTNRDIAKHQTQSDGDQLSFDVVTIDPKGTSVFAGQAPPNASVDILANGRNVATATADATGAWAITTDQRFAAGEVTLSLRPASPEPGGLAPPSVRVMVPTPKNAGSAPTPVVASPPALPAPITFLYNETTFTAEGRRDVELFARHLLAHHVASAVLTGHADERGSDSYNMELSRRRLQVVADYLRESGFVGKLDLIPKGRSEPYAGVDRRTLSPEEAFRLDRRVELLRTR